MRNQVGECLRGDDQMVGVSIWIDGGLRHGMGVSRRLAGLRLAGQVLNCWHTLGCRQELGDDREVSDGVQRAVFGRQLHALWVDANRAQSPPGSGDLFGIAMTPTGDGFYYVKDEMNSLVLAR